MGVLIMLVLALIIEAQDVAAQIPAVTVNGASDVTATSATISGSVNPNGLPAVFHVIYGPTSAYGYTGSYAPLPGQNTPISVSSTLTGLSQNTTYHYQLVATNNAGQGASADKTFTTLSAQPPTVTVNGASSITSTNATITGTVHPNGASTGYYAQWGPTTAYGASGPGGTVAADTNGSVVTAWMLGLSPNTTYHYRLAATNIAGTGYSADLTLTTSNSPPPPPPQPPVITPGTPMAVGSTNASIAGTVNPNGSPTTYYFQWGTSTAYGNTTTISSLPAQSTPLSVVQDLAGLAPLTTYHYQLVATNTAGSAYGGDQQFTTLGLLITNGNAFTYSETNGAVTILSYAGPGGNVAIPDAINGLPVTTIGDSAFYNLSSASLTGVTIPDSVASIRDMAFYQCGLTNVVIPDGVTNLGDAAFCYCGSLSNLTIGKGITTIRGGAESDRSMYGTFMFCTSLTRVVIPDTVTNITNGPIDFGGSLGAFYGCNSLTNVVIGKGLTFLGVGAFSYCANLVGVYFKGNAPTPGISMAGEDIFYVDPLVTLYYLPGTTGWGPTYANTPAVLWNPQVQSGNNSFAGGTSQFGFNIAGTADIPIVIEASTNLRGGSWVPLRSCTLTNGSISFSDPQSLTLPARIYRIRSP